jgi:hypothetical protein
LPGAPAAVANGVGVVPATRAGSGRVVQRAGLTAKRFVAADNLIPTASICDS